MFEGHGSFVTLCVLSLCKIPLRIMLPGRSHANTFRGQGSEHTSARMVTLPHPRNLFPGFIFNPPESQLDSYLEASSFSAQTPSVSGCWELCGGSSYSFPMALNQLRLSSPPGDGYFLMQRPQQSQSDVLLAGPQDAAAHLQRQLLCLQGTSLPGCQCHHTPNPLLDGESQLVCDDETQNL